MQDKNANKKQEFILIENERIRTSTIKRYKPVDNKREKYYYVNIYFSVNKMNEKIVFRSKSKSNRDKVLKELDKVFLS